MGGYRDLIIEATGCTAAEAGEIEDLMRDVVFHSTLDWIPRKQFMVGAKKAFQVFRAQTAESPPRPPRRRVK